MSERQRDVSLALGLGAAALVLRAIRWALTPVMFNDGPVFLRIAQSMEAGEWGDALAQDQHPLYPLFTLLAQRVVGDWETAGAAVSILAGSAAVVFLYALLRDAFDRQVACSGALLLAVHPYAVTYAADVQSEGLYLAGFVGALALLWRALARRSTWLAVGAGLAAGLAYLVRPEGAGPVLVGLGVVALETVRRRWPLRSAAQWTAALGLGTALAMAPYVAFLSARHGTLTFSQKKSIQQILGLEGFQEWIPLPALRSGSGAPLRAAGLLASVELGGESSERPPALSQLVQNTLAVTRYEIVILILLGAWTLRGPPSLRGRFMLCTLGLYALVLYGLASSVEYLSRRHALPVAVALFGYAGVGVPVLGRSLLQASRRALRVPRSFEVRHAIAAGLAVALALALVKGFRPHRQNAVSERRAAEWLRERGTEGHAVAAGKERVAFYAGAPFVRLAPVGDGLLAYLAHSGARWVVLDDEDRGTLLARNADALGGLRLVHEERAHGHAAFVYELRPGDGAQILE